MRAHKAGLVLDEVGGCASPTAPPRGSPLTPAQHPGQCRHHLVPACSDLSSHTLLDAIGMKDWPHVKCLEAGLRQVWKL